ncbi:TrmH family RNA methyltransferase [Thermaurantiacus sp.]
MFGTITSAQNPRLKRLRSLREKKYRQREGLFLAEGLRVVTEAVEAGWPLAALVFAAGREDHPRVRRLIGAACDAKAEILAVTPRLLSGLTGKDNPQIVVGAFEPRLGHLETLAPPPRLVAAERLRDPGNLGTLLRACDAAGAGGLVLLGPSTDPFSVEAVRASMGAIFTVPVVVAAGLEGLLAWKAEHRATLTGAALVPGAEDYRVADYGQRAILLLGNEAEGLPEPMRAACDRLVRIPMLGRADSLNVAMAGTILLYEAWRQQDGRATRGAG